MIENDVGMVQAVFAREGNGLTHAKVGSWLVDWIAKRNDTPEDPEIVGLDDSFVKHGLDSVAALELTVDVEDYFGVVVPDTAVWSQPSVRSFAQLVVDVGGGNDEVSNHKSDAQKEKVKGTERNSIISSEAAPLIDLASRLTRLKPTQRARLMEILDEIEQPPDLSIQEPLAVVGMGCRFPGASDPRQFWNLLSEGRDAIREVPPERWDVEEWYDPSMADPEKSAARWGGFLDHVDEFDPSFFGLSHSESMEMDPQQRLALEVAWETLEDAGLPPRLLEGSATSVFLGVCNWDYSTLLARAPRLAATGRVLSIAANRISYLLGLTGPSLVVDTACSSSLVAIDLAARSLRDGTSDLALAGGVNLMLSPRMSVAFSQAGVMAADGRCKTFDERADGYVRGEGCGLVALRLLSEAQRQGDRIYALISGSAVNHNGRSNGLTAPHSRAQRDVIQRALKIAGVAANEIDYVEAHGSGTPLGDAIELEGLSLALRSDLEREKKCRLGSVKTNIGHLESAAGIAGLIKTVLCLHHQQIPAHPLLNTPHPRLSTALANFEIPTVLESWKRTGELRRAGVSAFGFGGTNAHVILEEAPVLPMKQNGPKDGRERPFHIFSLSARSAFELEHYAERFIEWLTSNPEQGIGDICFTAYTGRKHFSHRMATVVRTHKQLTGCLSDYLRVTRAWREEEGQEKECSVRDRLEQSGWISASPEVGIRRLSAKVRSTQHVELARKDLPEVFQEEFWKKFLDGWARQYVAGDVLDWARLDDAYTRRKVALPTYPFVRQRCWVEDV